MFITTPAFGATARGSASVEILPTRENMKIYKTQIIVADNFHNATSYKTAQLFNY